MITFIFWAVVFAAAVLIIFMVLDLIFGGSDQEYLTPEQKGRIARDNQLRSAYRDFQEAFGRDPSVRELWLYAPESPVYTLDPNTPKEAS